MKKRNTFLALFLGLGFLAASCEKEEMDCETGATLPESGSCDLHRYTGDWNFMVDGDPATAYTGQIHKFNDDVLNVHYQPESEFGADSYFKQLDVTSCAEGTFATVTIPHGNTGGWTKKEGTITLTTFTYIETSRYVDFVTGAESFGEKTITGTKVE